MYRPTSLSRDNQSTRADIAIAAAAILTISLAVACSSYRTPDTPDSTSSSNVKAAGPTVAAAGEVVDSSTIVTPAVTFASAQAAYNERHYREATESFDVYVERHPENAFGHYMLGLSAWKSGDLERARNAFEHGRTLDSTNVKTLLNLGRVLLEQKQVEEAAERVAEAVALDSGSAEAHRMMARVHAARGERDSAVTSYRVALSIDPADSWSMNNLGLLLIEQGRYEEALPPLARAVELRPEAPAFANNLGVALERTGHATAAADAYRAALKADSTYGKASLSLARVDGRMDDSAAVDLVWLATRFDEEIQATRQARQVAKAVVKPDSAKVPER